MPSKYLKLKLSKLNGNTNIELLKVELYSVITEIFLSKEFFKRNSDISIFIDNINFQYAEYLFKSRTLLLARILRDINTADKEKLVIIAKAIQDLTFENVVTENSSKNKKDGNYVDSIMNQFGRG